MKKIYIAGVPGSGAELLSKLFYSFFGITHIDHSENLSYEVAAKSKSPGVWISNGEDLLSQVESEMEVDPDLQLAQLIEGGVQIVYVRRDVEALMLSGGAANADQRQEHSDAFASTHFEKISIVADIEDVMLFPDEEQARFAEALGLKIMSPWSSFPSAVPVKHRGQSPQSPQV